MGFRPLRKKYIYFIDCMCVFPTWKNIISKFSFIHKQSFYQTLEESEG